MFVVFLRFGANKTAAPQFMEAHKAWVKRGLDDGVFLIVGSLLPNAGGAIIAQDASYEMIEARVNADPFVAEQVVEAEILEFTPNQTDPRLAFLLD